MNPVYKNLQYAESKYLRMILNRISDSVYYSIQRLTQSVDSNIFRYNVIDYLYLMDQNVTAN